MTYSRRDFMGLSLTALAALMASGMPLFAADNAADGKREVLLLNDSLIPNKDPRAYTPRPKGSVNGYYPASGDVFSIDTPFMGHGISQNPVRPQQFATTEKWGPKGALVDARSQKVLNVFEAMPGNNFFGHSAFSADGAHLYCTEQNDARTVGSLVMRDALTLKVINVVPSHGTNPHECRSFDHGKTLMVANAGNSTKEPNIATVDIATGKLLHKIPLPAGDDVGFSHLDLSHDGWLCVGGSSRATSAKTFFSLFSFVTPDGQVITPNLPDDVAQLQKFEALNPLFLGASGLVAVSNPADRLLLIMDYKNNKLIGAVEMAGPTGIVPSLDPADEGRAMLMTTGSTGKHKLYKVQQKDADQPVITQIETPFGGMGAHLLRAYI